MIFQSFKMSWKSISTNKMRSFLTMLGIIIGVFSLVVLVSIVNSATSSVTDTISGMDNNVLSVNVTDDKDKPMGWKEVIELADEEGFGEAAPVGASSVTAKYGTNSDTMSITGTSPGYETLQDLTLAQGRFLNLADLNSNTYVAVINDYTATELFGSASVALGEEIALNGVKFTVIGVLEAEDSSGWNLDSMQAYIPYTTLMRLSDNVRTVSSFYVGPSADLTLDEAETVLTNLMLSRFESDSDAFSITSSSIIADALESVTTVLSLMLGGIAAISLVVGGIGIMNIMLVSVSERTREIGIRKAIGASYRNIMSQFLIESILISIIGCIIGILVSWIAIIVIGLFLPDYTFALTPSVVLIAVAFSAFVGIVFGSYPASKAAKKNPVEALRSA